MLAMHVLSGFVTGFRLTGHRLEPVYSGLSASQWRVEQCLMEGKLRALHVGKQASGVLYHALAEHVAASCLPVASNSSCNKLTRCLHTRYVS